jgi:hypothetical protein
MKIWMRLINQLSFIKAYNVNLSTTNYVIVKNFLYRLNFPAYENSIPEHFWKGYKHVQVRIVLIFNYIWE